MTDKGNDYYSYSLNGPLSTSQEVGDDEQEEDETPGCESFQELAICFTENALDAWHRSWRAVSHGSLPNWLMDNDFILRGHRPQLHSFYSCFKSIFRLHTETANIWIHLIGCGAMLGVFAYFISRSSIEVQWQDKMVFSAFFASAILCLGFSWLFHTVSCHSETVGRIFRKLDYLGITLLIMGSFVPWLYYLFYCHFWVKTVYICLVLFLGSFSILVSMWDSFIGPKHRPLRAGLFVGMGLSGVIPCLHLFIIEGFWHALIDCSLVWLFIMAACYLSGAFIYVMRLPERFFPGRFDIWLQSHQIMHSLAVVAVFLQYHGISEIANYRLTTNEC